LLCGAFTGQLTQILDDQQIVTPQRRAPFAKLLPIEAAAKSRASSLPQVTSTEALGREVRHQRAKP